MKKNLNEGLMDAIVSGIMTWATKKEIAKDPEFQKTIRNYQAEINRLSQSIEDDIKELEKSVGPIDRHPHFE